jgi:hypothetical protein
LGAAALRAGFDVFALAVLVLAAFPALFAAFGRLDFELPFFFARVDPAERRDFAIILLL